MKEQPGTEQNTRGQLQSHSKQETPSEGDFEAL